MSEIIVKLTSDRIRVKGGEYVQDIVRCRECKHWINYRKDEDDMGICGLTHYFTNIDDFCSYGERKDDE